MLIYGIISDRKAIRASAIEFLDNVLDKGMKAYLMPFLDPISIEAALDKGREWFNQEIRNREDALAHLIRGPDSWLRACAINCVDGTNSPWLVELIGHHRDHADPLTSETATMVITRIGLKSRT